MLISLHQDLAIISAMINGKVRIRVNEPLTVALLALLAVACKSPFVSTLRTGAPSLACMNLRPIHGLHRAKPASASQFFVSQSSYSYAPGQNVTVEIMTYSTDRYFRGFIIQAYNALTGTQIGHFLADDDSRPLDCSAATHRNNLNKKKVTLTWLPPSTASQPSTADTFGQWLGFRAQRPSSPIQPTFNINVSKRKRQLASGAEEIGPASNVVTVPPAAPTIQNVTAPVNHSAQVKFRASIVVTYDEFYTGFESTDQKFAKWDFAPKPTDAVAT